MSRGAGHVRLTAEFSFDAHFARYGRNLIGECCQGIDHVIDRFGELGDFALGFEEKLRFKSPFATAVTTLAMPRT